MKFSITSSLIIGAVFLLGASTSSNAIDTQPLVKSIHDSNIVKVRGGGGFGGSHGGGFGHGGNNFGHHDFGHHRWNGGWEGGFYGDPSFYYGDPGYDVYDTGPDTDVCVGPYCNVDI